MSEFWKETSRKSDEKPILELSRGDQSMQVSLTAITDDVVTLDGNHPLAGKDLTFDIELLAIV